MESVIADSKVFYFMADVMIKLMVYHSDISEAYLSAVHQQVCLLQALSNKSFRKGFKKKLMIWKTPLPSARVAKSNSRMKRSFKKKTRFAFRRTKRESSNRLARINSEQFYPYFPSRSTSSTTNDSCPNYKQNLAFPTSLVCSSKSLSSQMQLETCLLSNNINQSSSDFYECVSDARCFLCSTSGKPSRLLPSFMQKPSSQTINVETSTKGQIALSTKNCTEPKSTNFSENPFCHKSFSDVKFNSKDRNISPSKTSLSSTTASERFSNLHCQNRDRTTFSSDNLKKHLQYDDREPLEVLLDHEIKAKSPQYPQTFWDWDFPLKETTSSGETSPVSQLSNDWSPASNVRNTLSFSNEDLEHSDTRLAPNSSKLPSTKQPAEEQEATDEYSLSASTLNNHCKQHHLLQDVTEPVQVAEHCSAFADATLSPVQTVEWNCWSATNLNKGK